MRFVGDGLVRAVGITAANVPEAVVTDDIAADLAAQQAVLAELHIDRAYLSSALVRDRSSDRSDELVTGTPRLLGSAVIPMDLRYEQRDVVQTVVALERVLGG